MSFLKMAMLAAVGLMILDLAAAFVFTPLEIDNMPCKPENLKRTNRYICDSEGRVQCQHGWMESSPPDEQNPCRIPVCNNTCVHGECRGPDICACEIGWEGASCDICVPLPGCVHGTCVDEAFKCECDDGYSGAFCDIPSCNCTNGFCSGPNECTCNDGWSGDECDVCSPLPGCVHGFCEDQPNTCVCVDASWGGALCDIPKCDPPCVNGHCEAGEPGFPHTCMCTVGYRGDDCTDCRPYWECPNQGDDACNNPNECRCPSNFDATLDPKNLCNHEAINES